MIGQQLGHYYLLAKLGSGGMGDVYEAQDTRLPRTVAVKVLRSSLADEGVALRRFKREARLASSLNHPNICTVLEVDEAHGRPFIAMEFLVGQSLRERIEAGPVDLRETLRVGIDVASALGTAHDQRILHRDVTPGNIFLTRQGGAKLLDFGLAKHFRGDGDGELADTVTTFGHAPGTVYYMAPEQLDASVSQGAIDHRADLFAFGVVLYQMASGARPFRSTLRKEVIDAICHRVPAPVSTMMPPTASEGEREERSQFELIVNRLMAKSPSQRYPTAWAVRDALETLGRRVETSHQAPVVATPTGAFASVAVLPFAGTARDYCDGLSDAVREAVSEIDGIQVRPRVDAGPRDHVSNADIVIEGTVKRVERPTPRMRVIAFLYRTDSEASLGPALKIETQDQDLLAAQAEVGRAVASRIRSEQARAGGVSAARREEARHESREARHYLRDLFAGGSEQAIEHARIAIHHDPTLVEAHVTLAVAYNFLGLFLLMRPRVAFQMARRAAEHALALDERSALAHLELAMVRFDGDWNWEGAEASFRRAIELKPDLAIARANYSWLLVLLGRTDAAFAEAERARALAPHSPLVVASCAHTYLLAEDYDTCIAHCRECLSFQLEQHLGGPHPYATYLMGQALMMKQCHDEARVKLEEAASLGNQIPFYLGLLGRCYGEMGDHEAAAGVIKTLDAVRASGRYVGPHCYVYTYYGMGNREAALEHQEHAYEDGASPMNYLTPFVRDLFSLDLAQLDRMRQMRLSPRPPVVT